MKLGLQMKKRKVVSGGDTGISGDGCEVEEEVYGLRNEGVRE